MSGASRGFQEILGDSGGFQGLPGDSEGFQGLPGASGVCLGPVQGLPGPVQGLSRGSQGLFKACPGASGAWPGPVHSLGFHSAMGEGTMPSCLSSFYLAQDLFWQVVKYILSPQETLCQAAVHVNKCVFTTGSFLKHALCA